MENEEVDKKLCSSCKEEKELNEFYNLRRDSNKKQSRCKICSNKANKKSRNKKGKDVPILSDVIKFCPACDFEKSVDLFYKMTISKDGLFPKCKMCVDNKTPMPPKDPLIKNGVKLCSKCGEEKTINSFSKSSKEKSGLKSACKLCLYTQSKEYEKRTGYRADYRKKTKEIQNEYNRKYYYENKDVLNKRSSEYNRKFSKKRSLRHKKRLEEDNTYRISTKIRSLISQIFKNRDLKKNNKTLKILGCSFEEFKIHIENQFLPWMNWGNSGINIGEYDMFWQLDHIIPMCSAKTEEDVYLLNHWSNFQPR